MAAKEKTQKTTSMFGKEGFSAWLAKYDTALTNIGSLSTDATRSITVIKTRHPM